MLLQILNIFLTLPVIFDELLKFLSILHQTHSNSLSFWNLNSVYTRPTPLSASSSNLRYSARHFVDSDLSFGDISTPSWTANPPNIARLVAEVKQRVKDGAKAFVFDLLGNSSVRYEQFDGTTSLPYKSEGKFHLAGNVVISPDNIFQKTVESIVPILNARQTVPSVIIPLLPRYLFARCCGDSSHCTNWNTDNFPVEILSGFIALRHQVIKTLSRLHVKTSEWLTRAAWHIALLHQTLQHALLSFGLSLQKTGSTSWRTATRSWPQAVRAASEHRSPLVFHLTLRVMAVKATTGEASVAQSVASPLHHFLVPILPTPQPRGTNGAVGQAAAGVGGSRSPVAPTATTPTNAKRMCSFANLLFFVFCLLCSTCVLNVGCALCIYRA